MAAEKLGQTPPSNRQLLLLRFMGIIAPPPGSNPLLRVRGVLLVILLIVAVLALGWGIVSSSRSRSAGSTRRCRSSGASCWC